MTRPSVIPLLGSIISSDKTNMKPLMIERDPPCGSYSSSLSDLERFEKTGVQIYRYDPTVTPHEILQVTAVRLKTVCNSHWIGRDEHEISEELVSNFELLPQEELELILLKLKGIKDGMKLNEDRLEILDQALYTCPWFINPGVLKLHALRLKLKYAYWSPRGFLTAPFFSQECELSNPHRNCSVSSHTRLYWFSNPTAGLPLVPTVTFGGLLETTPNSNTNNICKGVRRFSTSQSNLQLNLEISDINRWSPEMFIGNTPIFLSSEGIYFSFLTHNGKIILQELCPSWSAERYRGLHKRSVQPQEPRFANDFPYDLQMFALEDEMSWSRAETEGQLEELANRTVREIIDLHFKNCVARRLLTDIAISIIPLNPRPYLSRKLGHDQFEVYYVNNKVFFKMASPISQLVLNLTSPAEGSLSVSFMSSTGAQEGYLSCSRGIIFDRPDPIPSQPITSCYLPLKLLGGLDLCTGSLTPSSSDLINSETTWVPSIKPPMLSMSNLAYKNQLEERTFSFFGPQTFVQSMGHSLTHDNSRYPSLSDYTSLIDTVLIWAPLLITLYVVWFLIRCFSGSPGSTYKSRTF